MTSDEAQTAPTVHIRFLYRHCNAIPPMRAFYSDGLGLCERSYRDDEAEGWLVYASEGLQLIISRNDADVPVHEDFASQPGDGGGPVTRPSCGIEYAAEDFAPLVERLKAQGVPSKTPWPTWRQGCYWGWTVNDPAGQTIEVYTHPAEAPAGDAPVWPDAP